MFVTTALMFVVAATTPEPIRELVDDLSLN